MKTRSETSPVFALILFYLILVATWQLLFSLHIAPDYVLPSPVQVINRLNELISDGFLLPSITATLGRMLLGFSMAVCLGTAIGLLMGSNRLVKACLKSLFLGLLTLPTAAWAPIALMIYGLNDRAIYFVIVMSATPAMALATADAIAIIPKIYTRVALTLGTRWYQLPFRVMLPAALPHIVTGIKLGWTLGWHGAVSAELIKSSVGLGYLLQMGRELSDAAQVIGIMIISILFGLLLDKLVFGVIEKRLRVQWGLE